MKLRNRPRRKERRNLTPNPIATSLRGGWGRNVRNNLKPLSDRGGGEFQIQLHDAFANKPR